MTVKELIDAASACDAAEIIVREHGCGHWIQGYRISKYAEQWRDEYTAELQEIITDGQKYLKRCYGSEAPSMTAGEIRDVIHGRGLKMKIIKKDVDHLPDNVAQLQVHSFQPRHIPSFHREQLTHNEFALDIDCYPEGWEPEKEVPKESASDQIDGQTDIFDFLGGTE